MARCLLMKVVLYGHTEQEALRFITQLASVLGVKPKYIIPAL